MAISFEKNQAELIAAWKDVLDDKSTTNWALFAYEGQSNELKVLGTGEGGLDELCEDLNSSKIMYAFVCVEDPKTTLKKFLLINWQGEGAPVLRKRACANHMPDVIKMFHGAHLTVNARNEDDIDLERLLNKLNTTGSTYSFKEPRKNAIDTPKAPVGTNYTRCIPTKELNISVMQDFWKNEEKEEKHRIAIEREQKRLQQAKLEQEQRAREEKEYLERENRIRINKLQPAHVPIKTSPQPLSPDKTTASIFQSRVVNDIERMREQRSQEARDLIGSRVLAAKAIFTKYTSEGQLQTKLNSVPPAKPIRNSISQRINVLNQFRTENSSDSCQLTSIQNVNDNVNVNDNESKLTINPINTERNDYCEITKEYENRNEFVIDGGRLEPVKPEMTAIANNDDDGDDESHNLDDYPLEPDAEQFSTIKRSPHSKSNSLQSPAETSSSNNNHTALYQNDDNEREVLRTKVSVIVQQSQCQSHIPSKNGYLCPLTNTNQIDDLVNEDDFICQDGNLGDLGLKACALYDYKAADESEITFDPGDIITHVDRIDEGWWQGYGPDGTYGLFPANYVEIID